MKTVILAGGEGTRLQPLTCNIPKAMVPVLNIPFLEHVLGHLRGHGLSDVILTLGHLSPHIQTYFGDGGRFGVTLSYTVEDTPQGTAGAVKMAERYLEETLVVLNGDIFTTLDISAMLAFHREKKAKVTIALTPVADPTSYGLVETGSEGRVTRFREKPSRDEVTTNMINAGTYILEPDVMKYIPPRTKFSFERELFPLLLAAGEPIYAYPSAAYWIDMGTPEKYLGLNIDLLRDASTRVGKQCLIHVTAHLQGPMLIGDKCTIERGVKLTGPIVVGSGTTIEGGAVVEGSVIWRDVRVGPQVNLKNSIVANNCCLSERSIIVGSVLGERVMVVSGAEVNPGSRIWPGTVVSVRA